MTDEPDVVRDARRTLRRLQMTHGDKITPSVSTHIGQAWNRALEIDPSGSQLKYVLAEAQELLKGFD